MFKNPEIKRLTAWFAVAATLLLAASLIAGVALDRQVRQTVRQRDAAMVAAVAAESPQVAVAAVRQLTKGLQNVQAGEALLAEYGYEPPAVAGGAALWVAGACAVALVCCLALFYLYLAQTYRRIDRIAGYIGDAAAGRPQLDVRDNAEGSISYLKNEAVKVTAALYHQAENSRQDKLALKDALSDISHQLKTPITSMTMLTDILLYREVPPGQQRVFLERIQGQLQRTQWLVTALLNLSKFDAGAVQMDKRWVDCEELALTAREPLLALFDQRGVRFSLACEPGCGFQGDIRWMSEALGNILKNCAEHTPAGGTVSLSCRDNPLYTEFLVTDTGEGIDPVDLPHLFERFYRGRNAAPDSVGIGLAMAKTIIEKHGGLVDARNQPGGGALFSIRLYKGVI